MDVKTQPWTDADNNRRIDLIGAELDGTITEREALNLDDLTNRFLAHREAVAPLPIKEVTELHERFKAKAVDVEKEQAACEAVIRENMPGWKLDRDEDGKYHSGPTHCFETGWLARAKLDRGNLPPLMELRQPQTPETGLGAIVGEWPGTEEAATPNPATPPRTPPATPETTSPP